MTNLIGLGVFSAWRLTHTVAGAGAAVKEEHYGDNIGDVRTMGKFDGFAPNNENSAAHLLRTKNGCDDGSILNEINASVFINEDGDEVYPISEGLPMSESDLEALGPSQVRSVYEEYMNHIVVKQLLSLYHIHNSFNQLFNSEGVNIDILTSMSEREKEVFVQTLINMIPEEKQSQLKSFSDIIGMLDMESFTESLRKVALDADYKLYNTIRESISLNDIENLKPEKPMNEDSLSLLEVLKKYKHQEKLDTTFMLDTATSLMSTPITDIGYAATYDRLNKCPTNENFKILGLLLTNQLLRSTNYIPSEAVLHKMIQNTILTQNRAIYNTLLSYLNIASTDLKRDKSKKASLLIRKITHGSSLRTYTYSLQTYLTSIKGMAMLGYSREHIADAVKKLLKSLTVDERVLYFNNFGNIKAFSLNLDHVKFDGNIDKVLLAIIQRLKEQTRQWYR